MHQGFACTASSFPLNYGMSFSFLGDGKPQPRVRKRTPASSTNRPLHDRSAELSKSLHRIDTENSKSIGAHAPRNAS